jgi:hypothetical protein
MATKKPVKASQKSAPKIASKKPATKSAPKPIVKPATKSVVGALSKMVSKVKDAVVEKISAKQPEIKSNLKSNIKTKSKPTKSSMSVEVRVEKAKIDSGSTLLEMAKEEMFKVNAPIAEAAEKAEKAGKFKPIKLERGNLADEKAKWQELFKRYGKDKAVNYKMSDQFESLKPINHKVLGWGFVLTNENNRLEILFENGIKLLICNYKP